MSATEISNKHRRCTGKLVWDPKSDPGGVIIAGLASARADISPFRSTLCRQDVRMLESCHGRAREIGAGVFPMVAGLLRIKLAQAEIRRPEDVDPHVATLNSRLVFEIDGRRETRTLICDDRYAMIGATMPLLSLTGATLIGMRAGQHALLPRANRTIGHVALVSVAYQPEAIQRQSYANGG